MEHSEVNVKDKLLQIAVFIFASDEIKVFMALNICSVSNVLPSTLLLHSSNIDCISVSIRYERGDFLMKEIKIRNSI